MIASGTGRHTCFSIVESGFVLGVAGLWSLTRSHYAQAHVPTCAYTFWGEAASKPVWAFPLPRYRQPPRNACRSRLWACNPASPAPSGTPRNRLSALAGWPGCSKRGPALNMHAGALASEAVLP